MLLHFQCCACVPAFFSDEAISFQLNLSLLISLYIKENLSAKKIILHDLIRGQQVIVKQSYES